MFNFKNEIKDIDMAPEELVRLLRNKFGGKSKSNQFYV